MRTRFLFFLGVAVALLPGVARAEFGEFSRSGFYVGAGGLYTQNGLIEDQLADLIPIGIGVDDSWGVSGQLGYRAFSFLAAELEYDYVDGYNISAFGTDLLELRGHLLTGNVKWIMPFWRIQPYLLGGIGFMHWDLGDKLGLGIDEVSTDFAVRTGGGLDFHLTSQISLNVSAEFVWTDTEIASPIPGSNTVDYLAYITVGAGVQYRFWGLTGHGGRL